MTIARDDSMVTSNLTCCACAHRWVCTHPRMDIFEQKCPSCGKADSKVDKTALEGQFGIFIGGDLKPQGAWRGSKGTSLAMPEVAPEHQAAWKADVPSIEFNQRGQVVYRNEQHQRQVYREMNRVRAQLETGS